MEQDGKMESSFLFRFLHIGLTNPDLRSCGSFGQSKKMDLSFYSDVLNGEARVQSLH